MHTPTDSTVTSDTVFIVRFADEDRPTVYSADDLARFLRFALQHSDERESFEVFRWCDTCPVPSLEPLTVRCTQRGEFDEQDYASHRYAVRDVAGTELLIFHIHEDGRA